MTRKTIKEIIRTYLENDVPDQVRESFEKWMLEKDSWEEKSDALESLWESYEEESNSEISLSDDVDSIIAEAEQSCGGIRNAEVKNRKVRISLWLTSAAAIFLAVICILQFYDKGRYEMCLAASDSAKASFVLPDGSIVWLNRDSRLYYSGKFNYRNREVRLEGEGFFDVKEKDGRPFTVHASDIDITVLGTEFTVSAYEEGQVKAYLQEGSVRIDGPALDNGIILSPDQMISYSRNSLSYRKSNVKASNHTTWINDKLVFDNSSLYDIFQILSHWYHVDIKCEDEDFARNTNLSFTVRQEPVQEILSAIQTLAPVSYSMDLPYITITKK